MLTDFIIPHWSAPANIKAFTSTRVGGVSSPPYSGLNVGDHVGDDERKVYINRELLCLSAANTFSSGQVSPIWLKQEHTVDIAQNSDVSEVDLKPFDGFYTTKLKQVCTVMTADCLPVFITNKQGTEVALVHAGWRGLADGIVENAIALFSSSNSDILVHCGPAISQKHFEIGVEVKQQLGASDEHYLPNSAKPGHYYCDLKGVLRERMSELGVEYTYTTDCTFEDDEKFYSYRRDGVTGRIVSMVWIT